MWIMIRLPAANAVDSVPFSRSGQALTMQKGDRMKNIAGIIVLAAALGAASTARADIVLDNIAPSVTKCWGNTCVMPDAAVNATLFDISAKKWTVGTTSLGAGIALLFASDQAMASGLTVHLTGVLSQEEGKPSFYMPTIGVIVARYFEVGYSRAFNGDGTSKGYLSFAGNVPWDVFTKATLPQRAMAARMAERAERKLTERDF
jgi:hypothetical protein